MEQFTEGESTCEEIKNKLRQNFGGKIVRKDLTKKIKEGANVPVYVLEFLLGQYCSSDDETVIVAFDEVAGIKFKDKDGIQRKKWYADCSLLDCTRKTSSQQPGGAGRYYNQWNHDKGGRTCKHASGMPGQRCKESSDSEYLFCGFCKCPGGSDECISVDSVSECGGCGV